MAREALRKPRGVAERAGAAFGACRQARRGSDLAERAAQTQAARHMAPELSWDGTRSNPVAGGMRRTPQSTRGSTLQGDREGEPNRSNKEEEPIGSPSPAGMCAPGRAGRLARRRDRAGGARLAHVLQRLAELAGLSITGHNVSVFGFRLAFAAGACDSPSTARRRSCPSHLQSSPAHDGTWCQRNWSQAASRATCADCQNRKGNSRVVPNRR